MTEEPGHINSLPLLDECAEALRQISFPLAAHEQARAVIIVLRRRGLLNTQGVEIVRAEMGDRK